MVWTERDCQLSVSVQIPWQGRKNEDFICNHDIKSLQILGWKIIFSLHFQMTIFRACMLETWHQRPGHGPTLHLARGGASTGSTDVGILVDWPTKLPLRPRHRALSLPIPTSSLSRSCWNLWRGWPCEIHSYTILHNSRQPQYIWKSLRGSSIDTVLEDRVLELA